jgi:hypothetical protein
MSRWAKAFSALSKAADTLDTTRHSAPSYVTASQSVQSVAPAPAPAEPAQLTRADGSAKLGQG